MLPRPGDELCGGLMHPVVQPSMKPRRTQALRFGKAVREPSTSRRLQAREILMQPLPSSHRMRNPSPHVIAMQRPFRVARLAHSVRGIPRARGILEIRGVRSMRELRDKERVGRRAND